MSRTATRRDHSVQHLTDVNTRRVYASAGDGRVAIGWDYPGSTLLQVRILRSESGPARSADEAGQSVVYEDVTGSFRDAGLVNGRTYHYSVFARHLDGEWVRWEDLALRPQTAARCAGPLSRLLAGLRRSRPAGAILAMCLGLMLGGVAPAEPCFAAPVAEEEAAVVVAAAVSDPAVAAVLGGVTYETEVTVWSVTPGEAAGATVTFSWPAEQARNVQDTWPLVTSLVRGTPVPPYETVSHRVRLSGLSSLRVDVLTQEGRVLQMLPLDGRTSFVTAEETWPPFSWLPWLTARPWLPLPLLLLAGAVVVMRAWRRSRAWNRKMPSMSRHDRQFIGRQMVILFLVAGLAWQVYQAVSAVRTPMADPGVIGGSELAALPILLFPPAVFVAALVLELTPQRHRVAWGLVAVLSGAGSVYYLATAITGAATNINLSSYLLLGIACLLASPRAFSPGRTGWSREGFGRYM